MATPHHPRRGSMGYYPRVRAKKMQGSIRSWPEVDNQTKIQAFAGYKVGMTHVEMVDYRKTSVTAGQTIASAVTVVEVPPLTVAGIRYYDEDDTGLAVVYEKWAEKLDKNLLKRITTPKARKEKPKPESVSEVRLIVHTNPSLLTGVPSKVPDIFEIKLSGSKLEDKMKYADEKLGKEIRFDEFSKPGKFVDAIGVTKGKGFTGHVERFGVKLLPRKNRKHRRMIGTLGPWHPDWVRNTVPQAGQMGTHQRTAHNIRVIKYSKKEENEDINVSGGFPGYGMVRNDYVLVHGSIPGPSKRLIKFRDPARQKTSDVENLVVSYISKESKQGD
ncbi:MAG: 50S ribosomal protein L3 [Thermoplasmataceae archaeon]